MMSIARPKIFAPSLRLYDRAIHPEFFRIVATKTVRRSEYEVSLSITSSGHLLQWTDEAGTLTEVVNTHLCELPDRVFAIRELNEVPEASLAWPEPKRYRSRSRLEEYPPEFFGSIEKEFFGNLEPDGLLYHFGFSGRMPLGGISYIGLESRRRELKVRAIHTFPDDCAILTTESRIRVASR